jgi:Oxidoreductase family, C-terminal alpha/beta domain
MRFFHWVHAVLPWNLKSFHAAVCFVNRLYASQSHARELASRGAFGHPPDMQPVTRRQFLQSSALGAIAVSQVPGVLEGAEPDRRLRLGLLGCGRYGMEDTKAALKAGGVEITGICDVDSDHLNQNAETVEKLQGNGEKQTVFVTDDCWEVIPRGNSKDRQVHESNTDAGLLHMTEFLNAVRERQPPGCLIEDACRSTASVKLAMIACETGSKVQWDAQREEIIQNPAALDLLQRAYRKPWKHPVQA